MSNCYARFFNNNDQNESPATPITPTSAKSDASDVFLKTFFKDDENNKQDDLERKQNLKKKEIENEINDFRKIILEEIFKKDSSSSTQFSRKHSIRFPLISKLALLLLTIQSSSAFIERFYSICGVVCKPKASNMKDDLIIKRSMLKVNMKILDSLNIDDN